MRKFVDRHRVGAAALVVSVSILAPSAFAQQSQVTVTSPGALGGVFTPIWAFSAQTELSYATFSGTRGYPGALFQLPVPFNSARGSGNQTYLDTSYSLAGNPSPDFKFEFLLKGGYVRSEQTTFGFTGRYQGPTDTLFSATGTYLGFDGFQPYLSVSANLPTGKAGLPAFGARARLDPDLVSVPTFGEGLNFGPTVGVNIPITPEWLANISGGVTWREAYYREGNAIPGTFSQLISKFKPGLATAFSASLTYSQGAFTGQGQVSYSSETTTFVDNLATYRSGRRYMFSLLTSYAFTDTFSVAFNGTAGLAAPNYSVHPDTPNQFDPTGVLTFPNGVLRIEDRNSNNKIFSGRLTATYLVLPTFSISPYVSVLYRQNNSYVPTSNIFIPAKNRYAVGASARYALTDKLTLTGRVEHIRTYERGTFDKFDLLFLAFTGNGFLPATSSIPLNYQGWQLAGGLNYNF